MLLIMKWILCLLTNCLVLSVVTGIRIIGLEVPSMAFIGDVIRLRCDYEMDGGSTLYSLKWYKDNKEIYRYVPGNGQTGSEGCSVSFASPSLPGVTIDCSISSEREVVLQDVSAATAGEYRCEVIGDHPAFRREERKAKLTVFSEPLEIPVILGVAPDYAIGSKVSLNCTSKNHEYVPTLTWLVNGEPPKEHEILYPYLPNQKTVGLFFIADETRFIHGQAEVTCRAELGVLHQQSASKTLSIPGLVRLQYFSQGSLALGDVGLSIALLLLISTLI